MTLPLVLLLLLALSALAHGGLVLARRELQAARTLAAAVQARAAARGAVEEGWEKVRGGEVPWDSSWGAAFEVLHRVSKEGVWREATLWRLGPEMYLVEGKGGSVDRPGVRREGRLMWVLDPVARLRGLRGAVEAGRGVAVVGSGRVEGGGKGGEPWGWPAGTCDGYGPLLAEAMPPGGLAAWPVGGIGGLWGEDGPGLGLLVGSELLDRLDEAGWKGGVGVGCPGKGAPLGLAFRQGGELAGGWLCGVVGVAGDLLLRKGQVVQGVVVVGGDLVVGEGSRVEGWVGVRGRVVVEEGSVVRASGCAFLWALEGLTRLREPVGLRGGGPFSLY